MSLSNRKGATSKLLRFAAKFHEQTANIEGRPTRLSRSGPAFRNSPIHAHGAIVLAASITALAAAMGGGEALKAAASPVNNGGATVAALSDEAAHQLIGRVCGACHSADMVFAQHRDPAAWQATVAKMRGYGAAASTTEFAQITDYLTRTQGPAQLKAVETKGSAAPAEATAPSNHASVSDGEPQRVSDEQQSFAPLPSPFQPVTAAKLKAPADSDWLMWRRTYNDWAFSPLKQVTPENVGSLRLVWTRQLAPGGQEGTPIAYNGILIMPEPRNVVRAYNALTGELLWEYKRGWPADLTKTQPDTDHNRNLAIYGDKVFGASADGFIYALDVKTGKLVWQTMVNDYRRHPSNQPSGPIVADGKVISGRACWPSGGPEGCVIVAQDAETGKEVWRTGTIARPGTAEDKSWGNIPYAQRGHVGAWMPPSYDPETNLIFMGTSTTSPAPKYELAGTDKKYLYHNSTLAIDARTGKIVWYYQHGLDNWDHDNVFERLLVDTVVAPDPKEVSWINPKVKPGEKRAVVTGIPSKNGIIYTLDRRTGEFLWARPTIFQNVVSKVGGDGVVTANPDSVFTAKGQTKLICPSVAGGKNWPAGAYDPALNIMFFPLQELCDTQTALLDPIGKALQQGEHPDMASLYGLGSSFTRRDEVKEMGEIQAYSASTGSQAWAHQQQAPTLSLVATGGKLVFGGDNGGWFHAFDSRSGKELWKVNLGAPVSGFPISFAVDGRQYVVASTGSSYVSSIMANMAKLPKVGSGNGIFVFALP